MSIRAVHKHIWFEKNTVIEIDGNDNIDIIRHGDKLPNETHEDYICRLNILFSFLGVPYIKVSGCTIPDFYEKIYNKLLNPAYKYVFVGRCGCNMGHCSAITCYNEIKCSTYEELFARLSSGGEVRNIDPELLNVDRPYTIYEHPDSVILSTKIINKVEFGRCGIENDSDINFTLDPNYTYIGFSYIR